LSSLGNAICVHQLTTSPGQGFIFKGFVSKGLASSPNTVLNISQSISSRFFWLAFSINFATGFFGQVFRTIRINPFKTQVRIFHFQKLEEVMLVAASSFKASMP
jgi:hypothetical protein